MEFEITAEQARRNVAQYLDTVLNIFTNYFLSHIIEKSEQGKKNITYGMFVPYLSQNEYSYTYSTEQDFISKLICFVDENKIVRLETKPFREFVQKTSLNVLLKETAKQLEMRGFKVYTENNSIEKNNSFYSDFLETNNSNSEKESDPKEKLMLAISWDDDREWTQNIQYEGDEI